MKNGKTLLAGSALAAAFLWSVSALAHCDTMDGPVIQDAKAAFDKKDVTTVLKWVRASDEKQLKEAFTAALKAPARRQSFYELLVKVHREGEGEKYTGVKPAGTSLEPGVKETDQAIHQDSPDALVKYLQAKVKDDVLRRFARVAETKRHRDESVEAGRKYVAAYVDFVHYTENLAKPAPEAGHAGHHQGEE
ncbi:MAG: DUF6448 family protein [Oligoflexia bacterium]|nr:DUF6448 family protein [Oligoflexia bacterium]